MRVLLVDYGLSRLIRIQDEWHQKCDFQVLIDEDPLTQDEGQDAKADYDMH